MLAPIVFISSTSEDLKEHREQAARSAQGLGFAVSRMEDFAAAGHKPTLDACLEKVDSADIVVALAAHRYGWAPVDPRNADAKSITWLECERAWKTEGKEVLAFLVDESRPWPAELREDYRLVTERKTTGIAAEVERNEQRLIDFKQELGRSFRRTFTDPASLGTQVAIALAEWQKRHPDVFLVAPGDPGRYLAALEKETGTIRVTALRTKRTEPYFFPIDEIYIPLTTQTIGEREQRRTELEKALSHRLTVVVGDPGAGKSTFLRRVAFELCRNLRGTRPAGAPPFLPPDESRFPILIRVADLAQLLAADRAKSAEAPDWIPYFLRKRSEEFQWGLGEAFFQQKLKEGGCLLMVDGLDEAPERRVRERIARIFEHATHAFPRCDFLVSTRPQTNEGNSVLEGFHQVRIGALQEDEIATFFQHFARALALAGAEAARFTSELNAALQGRAEIRQMAANPVMLTALAVLQHNDQRLPEYRVDLYGSILGWLAAAREHKSDRPQAEECLKAMRKLALRMQDAPGGKRLVQFNRRDAAAFFAEQFGGDIDAQEERLAREMQDSGILSSVGTDLRFWHLSFQEYLAALEIGGLGESQQRELLFQGGNLYRAEWRETMRLLGCVLLKQGEKKVDWLFGAILERVRPDAQLADRVSRVALLSAMMDDLSRMKYRAEMPEFVPAVRSVVGIFQAGESEKIPIERRIEAADLLGRVGDPRLNEDNWVTIPAGTFYMGAQKKDETGQNYDPKAQDNETLHKVTLPAFRIRRYPVTVQEYAAFLEADICPPPEDWERQQEHPNWPVTGVNWHEAAAYCTWAKCRLPTEEEWERAARGPDSAPYPWGNEPELGPSRANYYHDEWPGHPTSVGLYPQGNTQDGLCDMLGNVWEWCADWYGPYGAAPEEKYKVMRGGSWYSYPVYVRVSCRSRDVPTYRYDVIGFRCAGD